MNPLGGGTLARGRDRSLDFLRKGAHGPWYGALRFLLANRSITTAIVGFSSLEEVEQNVHALENAEELDEATRRDLAARMAASELRGEDMCTGCGYCHDCPNGFDPTRYMQAVRDHAIYGRGQSLARWLGDTYLGQSPEEELALCVECGWCEEQCPQHLEIIEEIRKGKAAFA
jgi:predicted aldo/keto reductase-like oxidoreductase